MGNCISFFFPISSGKEETVLSAIHQQPVCGLSQLSGNHRLERVSSSKVSSQGRKEGCVVSSKVFPLTLNIQVPVQPLIRGAFLTCGFWNVVSELGFPVVLTASQSCESLQSGTSHSDFPLSHETHFLHWHSFLCKAEGCYGTMGRVCQPVYREPRSVVLLLKTTCRSCDHMSCVCGPSNIDIFHLSPPV